MDSEDSEDFENNSWIRLTPNTKPSTLQKVIELGFIKQIKADNNDNPLNKLYTACIGSKSI